MAAAFATKDHVENLCEEAICSVCLEYFKDPVSLECGHNFCQACLSQWWKESGTMETSCPQCRGKVLQRNLRPNRQLANLVEITKKLSLQGSMKAEGKERVCGKHQEPLKLFCKDDETSICVVCDRSKEHRDHVVVPLAEAARDYKHRIAEIEKTVANFRQLHQFLEEQGCFCWLRWNWRVKKSQARDKGWMRISGTLLVESLVQEMEEKCQQPPMQLLQDVQSLLQRTKEKITFERPVAYPPKLKWKIWEFCETNPILVAVMKQCRGALMPALQLQKANVTLDPDTACPWLVLSEDHKSVRYEDKYKNVPDNPKRFDNRPFVLGREEFASGRHFWDVFVGSEESWAVGVVRKSVRRKGPVNIGSQEGIWIVGRWRERYIAAPHPSNSVLSLSGKTKRIRVSLNCAANQVTFYDADTGTKLYVIPDFLPFSGETVLPFFYVYDKGYLKIS
ncbi:zinc finger protein RFP-like [Sceloporus undulatus]|uniref:zinc finger protein RFP-like n=1 Tax=Sceloporus undulatus TaxID=8520 RepID=UPI001C4A9A6D|nr:zinc finger protein RFP-like [Sceloporus undulatus]